MVNSWFALYLLVLMFIKFKDIYLDLLGLFKNHIHKPYKTELIEPTSQVQSLMLTKFSIVPKFKWLLRDRIEIRPLVWISLELTPLQFS